MSPRSTHVEAPILDGRTREARLLADLRLSLEQRLGATPSLEARQVAEQVLRLRHSIALTERKRSDGAALTEFEHELLFRHENALTRALRRLERLAPATPAAPPTLAESLLAERRAREASDLAA